MYILSAIHRALDCSDAVTGNKHSPPLTATTTVTGVNTQSQQPTSLRGLIPQHLSTRSEFQLGVPVGCDRAVSRAGL